LFWIPFAESIGTGWWVNWFDIISWLSWGSSIGVESLSPFAWSNALGINISVNTFLDNFEIVSQVSWSAEWMSWDKFFTSRPVASLLKRAVS
jgi:hypothetical protein